MIEDLDKAKARMLSLATKDYVSSATLIERTERMRPPIDGDTIRVAYWTLVDEGRLLRGTKGVRKA